MVAHVPKKNKVDIVKGLKSYILTEAFRNSGYVTIKYIQIVQILDYHD